MTTTATTEGRIPKAKSRTEARALFVKTIAEDEAALAAILSGEREDDIILAFDNGLAVSITDGKLHPGFFTAQNAPAAEGDAAKGYWTVRNGNGEEARPIRRSQALRDAIARDTATLQWLDSL